MTGGDILKFGLVGVGAYLLYEAFFATPAPAAATTSGTTTGGTTGSSTSSSSSSTSSSSTAVTVNAATVTALQNAAAGNSQITGGLATADQWSYFWSNTLGKAAIDPTLFDSIFFPAGRPASGALPTMTAQAFVAAIAAKGLQGYRRGFGAVLPLPMLITRGRGYSHVGGRR